MFLEEIKKSLEEIKKQGRKDLEDLLDGIGKLSPALRDYTNKLKEKWLKKQS